MHDTDPHWSWTAASNGAKKEPSSLTRLQRGAEGMPVFSTHIYRAFPGRALDLLADAAEAKQLIEKHGGVVTAWRPAAGGTADAITIAVYYADHASYGRIGDALQNDPEMQTFWARVYANPSGENIGNVVLTDLDPLAGPPEIDAKVLLTFTFRTLPGRLRDHLARAGEARAHLERLGARVRQVQAIGGQPNCITTILAFEDGIHYGECMDKLGVDEQFQVFWDSMSADPPAEEVDSSLSTRVELPA
jgi:hypothetical protein